MRQPITFAYGNLVFGRGGIDDPWALYRLATRSYAGLTTSRKREVMGELAGFAYTIGADFQILRVSRWCSAHDYMERAAPFGPPSESFDTLLLDLLEAQERRVEQLASSHPEVFLAVALRPRGQDGFGPSIRRALGLADPRGLTRRAMGALSEEEGRVHARIADFLDCERASTEQLQWLIRRAYCRSVGEWAIDPNWAPQALVLDEDDEDGEWRFEPLTTDLLRLFDAPVTVRSRGLEIESEHGPSHQTLLAIGALPETVVFPGPQAELLFAPLEALPWPVDAVFTAEWMANDRAVALARRRLVDADNVFSEEQQGHHGATANTAVRPAAARELEEYLTSSERPPLLRASMSLAVSGCSPDELEERVERVRAQYAPLSLHRPAGSQLDLFEMHLPAQRATVRDYDDILLCEQFGAMVPTATHRVGSDAGFYIGATLSGSAHPVLMDLTEAPRAARPPAILCSGTLGSGKTIAAELLAVQAFAAGSRVVSVDPKGDHRLDRLADPADVERIELTPDPRFRGLLDPLRIGPEDTRADLAYGFLVDVLPAPVPPNWQTEIRRAVDATTVTLFPSCSGVIERLGTGNQDAQDAGLALETYSGGGLLRLAFADPNEPPEPAMARRMTVLRIANLVLPLPGTPRSEMTIDERTGQALLRLLATYALQLMATDWSEHKVLLFDEAWMLLGDAAGRALVQRINRLCRSQNATPILITQALADVAELENLLGALFCFGVETESEARAVLGLLRLDPEDAAMRAQLQGFRRGRCLMRDYDGRVGAVQIDLADPELLMTLDTTPTADR